LAESWVDTQPTARKLTRVNTVEKPEFSALGCLGGDLRAKARWLYESESARARCKTLLTDGTLAMVIYRFMQASHRAGLTPLAMLFNKLNVIFGQCIIGRGADFGEEFVLIHSQGVVINTGVRGGKKVFIEHQVTIGAEKRDAPVLGDDVFVGAGAKILGTVRLGNAVKVGANAVVTKDVPDGATVVGIPARVVRLHGKPV
jgi:serine O-acetyltransferase